MLWCAGGKWHTDEETRVPFSSTNFCKVIKISTWRKRDVAVSVTQLVFTVCAVSRLHEMFHKCGNRSCNVETHVEGNAVRSCKLLQVKAVVMLAFLATAKAGL
jgi:hypothetical protein